MRTRTLSRLVSARVNRRLGFPPRGAQPGGPIDPPPVTGDPTLPRSTVDMTAPAVTGTVWTATNSSEFATALSSCASGDRINLSPGVTYIPPTIDGFRLPAKVGTDWVTITMSDANLANLPAINADGTCDVASANARVGFSHWQAGLLPTIQTYHGSGGTQRGIGFRVAKGCDRVYLRGIAFLVDPAFTGLNDLGTLQLGSFGTGVPAGDEIASVDDIPTDIIVQQCYVSNNITCDVKRAVEFHVDNGAIANSTIIARGSNHNEVQGMWSANCNGPHRHYNTAYVAPGINFFYGGVDLSPSYMQDRQPMDITVEKCWFYTPDEWLRGHPSYAGTFQNCKNTCEFKSGLYVLIDQCVFEGSSNDSGTMGQNGQHLTLKVLTEANYSNPKPSAGAMPGPGEGGNMDWMEVAHVTVRRNRFHKCGSGIDVMGVQDTIYSGPAVPTNYVLLENNLIAVDDTTASGYTGTGRHLNLSAGSSYSGRGHHWFFRHNTGLGEVIGVFVHGPVDDLELRDSIKAYSNNNYVGGKGWVWGTISGSTVASEAVVDANCPVITHYAGIGDFASRYGAYAEANGGTNPMGGTNESYGLNADGSLTVDSILRLAGSDGLDLGATVDVLALTSGVQTPAVMPTWP